LMMALIERLPLDDPEISETNATNFLTNTIRSIFFSTSPVTQKESENDEKLKHISLEEVLDHDTCDDCWVIIYDRVYDITPFLDLVSSIICQPLSQVHHCTNHLRRLNHELS
jgi:Cytochrome b5-like Heme/Steroid binding domain